MPRTPHNPITTILAGLSLKSFLPIRAMSGFWIFWIMEGLDSKLKEILRIIIMEITSIFKNPTKLEKDVRALHHTTHKESYVP